MATIPSKKLALRAFKIVNPKLTESNSGILSLLRRVLTETSKAAERRMTINADEPDRDLLANYAWSANQNYLFGMMLRIIPADNGGVIDESLFDQPTITMAQVTSGSTSQSQYKDHFYLALNNDFLVTTLSGNISIARLQTYINWLLGDVRGERLFEFAELTRLPEGVELSQIKEIQFVGGGTTLSARRTTENSQSILVQLSQITNELLDKVINDTDSLESIKSNHLIEARLLLKVKGKPKEMQQEEFQRVMSAIATNVTNDSGVVLRTKDGNIYTGEAIKVKKSVTVECLESANRINEEQLKQEMEKFLSEIRN